jgi:DNA repair protein RadC
MKTVQQIAEVRLVYTTNVKASDRAQIKTSQDAYDLFMGSWDRETIEHVEEFKLMLLNRSNKVLSITAISKGGTAGTVVDVKLILQYAIKANACAIIICHNHPSGALQASESDITLTRKIKDAASLMDIQILDHLIIIPEGRFHSLADEGYL